MRKGWGIAFLATFVALPAMEGQRVGVAGIVRDSATGQGLNGAIVEIASADRRYAVRSDETGEFLIPGVEAGGYRAVVRRIGYVQHVREISVTSGMKPVTFAVAPIPQSLSAVRVRGEGSGIHGQIGTADELKHIPGARVFVAGTRDSITTDSIGSYFMPVRGPGLYMVRVTAPGFIEDMFVVEVKRDAVSDGSRLLDAGDAKPMPRILWQDFDQRMSWRTVNSSALLSAAEIRRSGNNVTGVLAQSGTMVSRGMRLGPRVCVFVNGQARPGTPVNAYRTEDIKAIEVYGPGSDAMRLLMQDWPKNQKCSETGEHPLRGGKPIGVVVIWLR